MADPGRLAEWGTGREPAPAASPSASLDDAPPSPTHGVAPGAVGESGPAGPAVTDGTHAVVEDAVPHVPRRAGLPRLALVAIVGGSLVLVLAGLPKQPPDPAVLSEAPETAVPA